VRTTFLSMQIIGTRWLSLQAGTQQNHDALSDVVACAIQSAGIPVTKELVWVYPDWTTKGRTDGLTFTP